MALKAYTLDLALQTSSEFAIGNAIPNVAGIATDGKGFIPTKNSINKTITLSKGFGKFGGRLFEMTEQTVYPWDSGLSDADAYLVIDLTKQNSFKGTIEDGTYEFVDNQSSIVLSAAMPTPSANTLVFKLDGNYQDPNNRTFNNLEISGGIKGGVIELSSAGGSVNDLKVTGIYSRGNNSGVVNWTDRPSDAGSWAFWVRVDGGQVDTGLFHQWYYEHYTGGVWTRIGYYAGQAYSFTRWEKVATTKKTIGSVSATGYQPKINYAFNSSMVQITLAGGNPEVPIGASWNLPTSIPAPAVDLTFNLGSGILLNVKANRQVTTSGGSLPGNFFGNYTWVPA